MALWNSLGQDNWNKMHHDFFHHVMPLALALVSHHATGIGVSIR